jgi:hypothetical protein
MCRGQRLRSPYRATNSTWASRPHSGFPHSASPRSLHALPRILSAIFGHAAGVVNYYFYCVYYAMLLPRWSIRYKAPPSKNITIRRNSAETVDSFADGIEILPACSYIRRFQGSPLSRMTTFSKQPRVSEFHASAAHGRSQQKVWRPPAYQCRRDSLFLVLFVH